MSHLLFKNISILALLTTQLLIAMDPNPELDPNYIYYPPTVEGHLDQFADERVIVLYRGVHFLENQFSQAQRQQYIQTDHTFCSMYASAVYERAHLGYDQVDHPLLRANAQQVADQINHLNDEDECIVNRRHFWNQRYAFQQLYSNDYERFFQQLRQPSGDYKPIFENFNFTKNPLISFSDRVKHPGKYGFGLKNYGHNQALSPHYNLQGQPHHPILGKLYGIILDETLVEELMPLNVMKAHHSQALNLKTHFRNDILSEREISIAGVIPEECVVFEMPLQVPSFSGAYPNYYKEKYGLSKTRYQNYKTIFTNAQTTQEKRNKKHPDLGTFLL